MTDEQMQLAIAEACGWICEGKNRIGELMGRTKALPINSTSLQLIPDYLHDLNAMHEAVEKLTTEGFMAWCSRLRKTVGTNESMNATARQRAEAFLRTVGKWRDE